MNYSLLRSTHDGEQGPAAITFFAPGIVFDDGCMIGFFRMSDCSMEHFPALPRRLVLEGYEWRFVFFVLP